MRACRETPPSDPTRHPVLALRVAVGASSLGAVLVAQGARGLSAVLLGDDAGALWRDLRGRLPDAAHVAGDAATDELLARVIALVESPRRAPDLPLDPAGTAFQRAVWAALQGIPAGSTASYADVARRIGSPGAARAVARACGANPLAVVVPCHRVVRSDGALSGYRWGVQRKRSLLEREARG